MWWRIKMRVIFKLVRYRIVLVALFWRGVSVNVQKVLRIAAFVCLLAFCGRLLVAQGVFATLDGVLTDPTGAVVPNARITLTDAISGSARDTVTDSAGFYNFASVPVGSYNLSVSAGGFKDYKAS